MINSSTIDLKTLPWLPLEEKAIFPSRPAIYFAIDSLGTVQYIGRTFFVRTRWGKHHKYSVLSAIANVKVAYLFIDAPELLPGIEQALIEYSDPPLNMRRSSQNSVFARARVPKDIHLRFKIACLKAESDMDSVLNELIVRWLKEKGE